MNLAEVYPSFASIDAAKQQRILHAALEEFSAHDYAAASTNAIVEAADISKGLLFHYFGSKEGLFAYLFAWSNELLFDEILSHATLAEGDYFDLSAHFLQAKLAATLRYPLETRFYLRALAAKDTLPTGVASLLEASLAHAYRLFSTVTERLDEARLRKGISHEQAIKLVNWVGEGLTNEFLLAVKAKVIAEKEVTAALEYTHGWMELLRDLLYAQRAGAGGSA
jgi:AcrR family transcriptional regulator